MSLSRRGFVFCIGINVLTRLICSERGFIAAVKFFHNIFEPSQFEPVEYNGLETGV